MQGDKLICWANQLRFGRERASRLYRWVWTTKTGLYEEAYKPTQDADATGVP